MFLLSLATPLWFATSMLCPQVVKAYTTRVDLAIDTYPEENYDTMLRRAEMAARAGAQRAFDQDILVENVSIVVSVQNYGYIAPVLALSVSRNQWKKSPDPQRWAKYYRVSRSLLLFEKQFGNSTQNQPNQPQTTPSEPVNSAPANSPAQPPVSPANGTTNGGTFVPNPNATGRPVDVTPPIPVPSVPPQRR